MVKESIIIIVHPWDLAPIEKEITYRGIGHNDIKFEHHIWEVVRPYLRFAAKERWIGIAMPARKFKFNARIHPALVNIQDFVLYDEDDAININILKELGVKKVLLGGYGWDMCVAEHKKRYEPHFDVQRLHFLCLPTVYKESVFYDHLIE